MIVKNLPSIDEDNEFEDCAYYKRTTNFGLYSKNGRIEDVDRNNNDKRAWALQIIRIISD